MEGIYDFGKCFWTWDPLVPVVPLGLSTTLKSKFGNLRAKYFRALYWPLLTTATSFSYILHPSHLPEKTFLPQPHEQGQLLWHTANFFICANSVLKVRIYMVKISSALSHRFWKIWTFKKCNQQQPTNQIEDKFRAKFKS